jgi:cell division septation protein DedD
MTVSGNIANHLRRLTWHVCILLAAIALTGSKPAYADNAFLLQLGTFDSEDLARQKWEEVKARNSDVVGSLSLHIAQVALPPGNAITYRPQVGPVASREQAASLCNSLNSRSVQCYVVETAMFDAGAAADQAQEGSGPGAPEQPRAAQRYVAVASEEDASHAGDPDYIPPPMDSGPVIISTSEASMPAATSPAEMAEMPTPAPAPAASTPPVSAAPAAVQEAEPEVPAPVAVTKYISAAAETPAPGHFIPGREPRFLDAPSGATTVAPAPVASAPSAHAPAEAPAPKESGGFFGGLFSSASPEPAPAASEGVVGGVNVAEAVRVPLSADNEPARQKIVPILPPVHGLGGAPGGSTDKTLWAQISYFRDETQALTFYRQFSAAYPQYSDGVRIRITRPFAAATTAARVSLRVGPFAGTDDVRTICAAANRWNARCTVVRDIGASAAMNAAPAHAARNGRPAAAQESQGQYWAQLGTFPSSQEAWDAWRELKATHRKIAGHMRPSVTTPAASSATTGTFRLRTGPFTSEDRANDLCNRLQEASTDCLVVHDR